MGLTQSFHQVVLLSRPSCVTLCLLSCVAFPQASWGPLTISVSGLSTCPFCLPMHMRARLHPGSVCVQSGHFCCSAWVGSFPGGGLLRVSERFFTCERPRGRAADSWVAPLPVRMLQSCLGCLLRCRAEGGPDFSSRAADFLWLMPRCFKMFFLYP